MIFTESSEATYYTNNVYVSSEHKLQKFTGSGELIKCVGQRGSEEGEFDDPRGVTLYDNQVYVCDRDNLHIQVLELHPIHRLTWQRKR